MGAGQYILEIDIFSYGMNELNEVGKHGGKTSERISFDAVKDERKGRIADGATST